MPKKGEKLSEEQKAKMAAGRKKKKEEQEFEPTAVQEAKKAAAKLAEPPVTDEVIPAEPDPVSSPPLPTAPQVDPNLIATIVATVQSLNAQNPQAAQAAPEQKLDEIARQTGATVGVNGIQGVVSKYPVEKSYYPDPTERLTNEPMLRRFAMAENYIFKWNVSGVEYVKNNVAFSEPRFTLELFRRLYNDDGTPNGKAALVARNILHEDQMTTRVASVRLGLVEKFGEGEDSMKMLMDEVRYWRMQQWLLALFSPAKIETHSKKPTTQVINGKVVEVFDTESLIDKESAQTQSSSLESQAGVGDVVVPE